MSFQIEIKGLDTLRKKFAQAPKTFEPILKNGIVDSAKVIVRNEITEAPVKTGNLRRSILFKYSPIQAIIKPNSEYAYWVHEGTGIYAGKGMIRPKNAKVLAWRSGGQWVFAKAVSGQKPNRFVERAWKKSESPIKRIFDKMLKDVVGKL